MIRLAAVRRVWRLWPTALAVILAMILLAEMAAAPAPLPGRPAAAPALLAAGQAPESFTAGAVAAILARPLFRPGRRPPAAVSIAVDTSLPRLSAIVITAGGRSAIFIGDDGTASVLAAGGRIGAYRLRRITPDSVSLDGPNGAVTVHPQFAAANQPDQDAAPAVPAIVPLAGRPGGNL